MLLRTVVARIMVALSATSLKTISQWLPGEVLNPLPAMLLKVVGIHTTVGLDILTLEPLDQVFASQAPQLLVLMHREQNQQNRASATIEARRSS